MQEWLLLQDGMIVYVSVFFLLLGGAIGLPIPEDIPLILAGILAHNGKAQLNLLFGVCYIAIIAGDIFIYGIGWQFGPALYTKPWFRSRFSESKIKAIQKNLERRSILMIFLARHLFYLRTLTFLVCGAVHMDFRKFLIADALAALISAPIMIGLGYMGAQNYEAISNGVARIKHITLFSVFVILVIGIYLYLRNRSGEEDINTEV
jgi:membrane protein DedA with SNARE-associated domain